MTDKGEKPFFSFFFTRVWRLEFSNTLSLEAFSREDPVCWHVPFKGINFAAGRHRESEEKGTGGEVDLDSIFAARATLPGPWDPLRNRQRGRRENRSMPLCRQPSRRRMKSRSEENCRHFILFNGRILYIYFYISLN